jgi:hypothetical protein
MARRRYRYQFTTRRRASLRKAQMASARKRKAIGAGVGVLAAGAVAGAFIYGRKTTSHKNTPGGSPQSKPMGTNPNKTASKLAKPAARIMVTGSRNHTDRNKIRNALEVEYLQETAIFGRGIVVVHGGASGADSIADAWAKEQKAKGRRVEVEVHPANWKHHGRAAGPMRNQHMVNLGANVVLAFPIGKSPGTRHAMNAARIAGIKVREY